MKGEAMESGKASCVDVPLPPELFLRVKALAEAEGVSVDDWCGRALEAYLRDAERALEIGRSLQDGPWPERRS